MAITSKEINLTQLTDELGGRGLIADFNDPQKKLILAAEGSSVTEQELDSAIAAHVAINEEAQKLAAKKAIAQSIGLSLDDLATLLG
jgi:hypothetical protein